MGKKGLTHRRGHHRLRIIKALVAARRYQNSEKVQKFIEEGQFDLEDMEHCILSANAIQKVELDDLGTSVDGCKYTILGVDTWGLSFYTCGKIIRAGEEEELYFFITAHDQG
ncbi:MAG: hypothetical protein M3R52_00970 [Acidobacteriota bacterium]|nr:hypothetical protein [Acidobacteriota bacterium]